MKQIKDTLLFVGTKEEHFDAIQKNMKIVCAMNQAKDFVSHKTVVGWQGRCNPNHPNYLFKKEENAIYLNMIDTEDPKFVNDEMINPALDFIHQKITSGNEVFIYCSLGESRSPSIALMYLLENGLIEKSHKTIEIFKNDYYATKYQNK